MELVNVLIDFKGSFALRAQGGVMLRIRGISCYAFEGSFLMC